MKWGRETSAFDETFEASGDARPHYRTALSILQGSARGRSSGGSGCRSSRS